MNSAANVAKTITLSVPAGSYAISGKGMLGTTAGSARSTGRCTLTAGTTSDYSYERLDDGFYGHINTQLVHTFAAPGTISMTCIVFQQAWILGEGGTDATTKIVAVRTDTGTVTSGGGTSPSGPVAGAQGATG